MNAALAPRDRMAAETEAFLVLAVGEARLDRPRFLEVGAGDGRLAARLAAHDWAVTAIESDAKRAAMARRRGVRVIEADVLAEPLPEGLAASGYDVVFFSRVLHHLEPLDAAIERTDALLAPGGLVIGEEFAYERADERAILWLADIRTRAVTAGLLGDEPDPARETLDTWMHHHAVAHRIHRGDALLAGLAARFLVEVRGAPPYLYRYLCSRIVDSPESAAFIADAIEREKAAMVTGELPAIGLRFIARRPG